MLRLALGDVVAEVDPAWGGRLGALTIDGAPLLLDAASAGPHPPALAWGSYPMAPWVGRLGGAAFTWQGHRHALPADHGRHAIHGLVHSRPARVEAATETVARLSTPIPSPPWPWIAELAQEVGLSPGALTVTGEVRAEAACQPVALGWHPWLRRGPGDVAVRVPADEVVATDAELIATGATEAVRGATDLRALAPLGGRRLDHTFVGLDGPVTLAWPERTVELHPGEGIGAVHVFVTDDDVCVEPLSAWPNAHNGDGGAAASMGLAVACPGTPVRASWSLRWS
ncbi:MAG: hypothetical protein R6T85_04105 [Egibacteraceae bacterium]